MIGLGLSLMGGALAQNAAGGGETMYFPSRVAVCLQPARPTLALLDINVNRAWSDETVWFDCKSAFTELSVYAGLGAGIPGATFGRGCIATKGAMSEGLYRISTSTQSFPSTRNLGEEAPADVELSFFASVGNTVSTCSFKFDISGLDTISGTTPLYNLGSDTTNRYVRLYSSVREFRGLSFRTAAGYLDVNFLPLADGFGNHAVWSTHDNTLVEI